MLGDLFKKKQEGTSLEASENRYRRIFEAAQDGILLLDFQTGKILDVNKFLIDMLGYTKEEFLTKHIWEVGLFRNEAEQKENFATLQEKGYVRFENLPLETKDGRHINVEFVANAYKEASGTVIQCNIRDITDRVKLTESFKISELRYRRLFETAQDGILILEFSTGLITDVNKFLIDMLGYTKEEILTKHLWEVGLFKNEAEQKENFATLQEKGYIRFEDLPLETKERKSINVEFVANAYQVNGTTVIQCNIRDITDRVRAEAKVKWLSSFPEQDTSPILEMEKGAGITYVNPLAVALFPEIGDLKMSHPYVNESEKYFRELNDTDRNVERREIQIKGRWYLQDIKFISPDRLRIYGHDITDLKNIEYKLASGKSFNDAILSSIDEAVIVCDREGKISLFNKIAEKLTGFTPAEAIGLQYNEVLDFVKEIDGAKYAEFASKVVAENRSIKLERQTMLVNKNGIKTPVAGSASPIPGVGGSAYGSVFAIYDATKEHDIDKAKTEFVSLASHQMRTPLTAINWYSELLQSVKYLASIEKRGQFAQEINIASKRMSALVNSLLNVSRLEMGTFTIEPKIINPIEIAKLNLETLRLQIGQKHLNLKEEYDPNASSFSGDPNLLEIVFQNLLTNAVKYTPDGGDVTVAVKRENDMLNIIVADTGVGIPPQDQGKIFGKLFRSDNVKNLDPGGSGLGLYILHEIVINSGGNIRFESTEGKGSTFYVTFPMSGMVKKDGGKKLIPSTENKPSQ